MLAFLLFGYNSRMTKEEILEQQVEALEKLLDLKSEIVDAQARKIDRIETELAQEKQKHTPYPGVWYPSVQPWVGGNTITLPTAQCPATGSYHEYPSLWNGTSPAPCSKCGQYPSSSGIITIGGTGVVTAQGSALGGTCTDTGVAGATVTSGYIAPAANVVSLARK